MRVAIAGAGAVGRSIAEELIENGHHVMLIERDPDKVEPGPGAAGRVADRPTPPSSPRWRRPACRTATW